ncbi:MAG: 3-oxoacyl-ACP reductase, partial [Halomonas sp.]|nr:3-oxoacyl-ACP reductase [Halomonas sp.]
MSDLQGKIALVTGASRGIGKAIATQLAAQGATVIGTATSEGGADAITEYLAASGGKGMKLNVTKEGAVDALIKAINEEFGAVEILINNAGITRDNLLMRMKDEEWQAIIDTNLTAIFSLPKAVLRGMMKKRCGRIVNVGSVVGSSGNAGQAN